MKKHVLSMLVLAVAMKAGVAQAQDQCKNAAEAGDRFAAGTSLYNEGDYKLALIEFERTHDLCPNYKVLYNIGQVNMQLNNYARARMALERYLKEGGTEIPPARAQRVEADLTLLRQRTAFVRVVTNVPGATVLIDDTEVGVTPFALLVDAGKHNVSVKMSGHLPASKAITLAGSDDVTVKLDLAENKPLALAAPAPLPAREGSNLWIPWTITGFVTAGAVASGIVSLSTQSELAGLRVSPTATEEDRASAASRAKTLALTTDILTGAAILSAGLSLYLTLKPSKKESTRVGIGPGSVMLSGSF
jgi:tetratricopeptide (TPR) repeat protein